MPEQRIQVVFHVPNEVSEAGLCQLVRATRLFAKQSKEETDKGVLSWWNALFMAPGGPM